MGKGGREACPSHLLVRQDDGGGLVANGPARGRRCLDVTQGPVCLTQGVNSGPGEVERAASRTVTTMAGPPGVGHGESELSRKLTAPDAMAASI